MAQHGVGDRGANPTRRTALKLAVATAGAGGLASILLSLCGDRGRGGSGESLPFDVWRALRDALRKSPDHLIARSEALVAGGDADAIFRFVRDEISTFPSADSGYMRNNSGTVRWGWRAALRCGGGTPREKGDLLLDLLKRAGHDVELVTFHDPKDKAALAPLLKTPAAPTFAPEATDDDVKAWRKRLKLPAGVPAVQAIDVDGRESAAVYAGLGSSIPQQGSERWDQARAFDLAWRPDGCAVRHKAASGARLLSPMPGMEPISGADAEKLRVTDAGEPDGMIEVEVSLLAAHITAPAEHIELLKSKWTADELVGRQLLVQLLPACYPENWVITRFGDVQVFVPMMALQDPQRPKAEVADTLVLGDAITREGEQITAGPDGVLGIGENALGAEASDKANTVKKLEIEVSSPAFPRIDVKLDALDASGARVEGLSAGDFRVSDDGAGVTHLLIADRESPRVAVLVDQSGSMPGEYLGQSMDTLYDALEIELKKVSPDAILLRRRTDSHLWTNLALAAVDAPAFIVYVTDGDVYDESTPTILEQLGRGPRALIVGVHDGNTDVLQSMAEATGGKSVLVEDTEGTKKAIAEMLAAHSEPSYRIRYTAPHRDPGTHKVKVEVPDAGVAATGSYLVPGEMPPGPPQFSGLYLKVSIGGKHHLYTLAGLDHRTPTAALSPERLADVRAAMFGTAMVSFEATGVPTSVWLDDLISAGLSSEELHQAVRKDDAAGARHALHEHYQYLPLDVCQATMLGLPQKPGEPLAYQTGLRIGIFFERVRFVEGDVERAIDQLATAGFRSADMDASVACETTAKRTTRQAVVERDRFPMSTLGVLAGVEQASLDVSAPGYVALEDAELRKLWYEHWRGTQVRSVAPAAAEPLAFVSLSRGTGAAFAVLGDGRAASHESGHNAVSELMTLDNHLSARGAQSGTAFMLGLIDDLEALLAGHARSVNMITSTIDAAVTDAGGPLAHFACHAVRNLVFGAVGSQGANRELLDPLLSLLAEENPFACPSKGSSPDQKGGDEDAGP